MSIIDYKSFELVKYLVLSQNKAIKHEAKESNTIQILIFIYRCVDL